MTKLRKNWREYLLTAEEAETEEEAFIVFEEDNGKKFYDLSKGIFSSLEVAKEYAKEIKDGEDVFVARYGEYISGNYDYLFEARTKRWKVEFKRETTEEFDNWIGDLVEAETEEEAEELAKQWLIDNGYEEDPEKLFVKVTEEVR